MPCLQPALETRRQSLSGLRARQQPCSTREPELLPTGLSLPFTPLPPAPGRTATGRGGTGHLLGGPHRPHSPQTYRRRRREKFQAAQPQRKNLLLLRAAALPGKFRRSQEQPTPSAAASPASRRNFQRCRQIFRLQHRPRSRILPVHQPQLHHSHLPSRILPQVREKRQVLGPSGHARRRARLPGRGIQARSHRRKRFPQAPHPGQHQPLDGVRRHVGGSHAWMMSRMN